MSKGGSDEQVTRTEPPAYVKPYIIGDPKKGITGVLPEAQRLYESDKPQYFPGSTVAPMAPESEIALQGTAARAMAGSPLNAAAGGYVQDVLGGKYLNDGNPLDDALFQSIQSKVAPAVNSAAGLAGRAGSGAHEGVMTRELTNAYAPFAFQQYNTERGLQQNAAAMAPELAAQDYIDLGALKTVGDTRQQQGQAELTDLVNKWNFGQNIDQQKLNNFISAVYGAPGATTYSSTPSTSGNTLLNAFATLGSAAMLM